MNIMDMDIPDASQLNQKYYRVADKLAWSIFKTCDWLVASFLNVDWFRKGSGELFAEAWYFWFNCVAAIMFVLPENVQF